MQHISSLKTKGIVFLDQIITIDSAYLIPYKELKKSVINKSGRQPKWYKFLQEHITLTPMGRLNIDLNK